jgi:hypothetical protein
MPARFLRATVGFATLLIAAAAAAEDAYYCVPLDAMRFAEGKKPPGPPRTDNWRAMVRAQAYAGTMGLYLALDGPGEAYATLDDIGGMSPFAPPRPAESGGADGAVRRDEIVVRTNQKGKLTGRLYYPKPDWSGMEIYRFAAKLPPPDDQARHSFYETKAAHYQRLLDRQIPGGAWFRHQAQTARAAAGRPKAEPPGTTRPWRERPGADGPDRSGGLADTYDLMTGGRAVSESLQLDRLLRPRDNKPEDATIDVDTIDGISVEEIDWKPLVKDLQPALDPLSALVPADQHAIFFPTFSAAVRTADAADSAGTPVLRLAEPRSEDARTLQRYERQLGLSLTGLGRLLGPHAAQSVALTGSDPYFRTGTDVAVLFEAKKPAMLEGLLTAQISAAAAGEPDVRRESGQIDGLPYQEFRSPDRTISSYIARLGNGVAVTNSPYQLGRLAAVHRGKTPAIASLPEYIFFRNRYRLGDPEETALIFLSDATIRRWCGPRWRIASSRQTCDLGVLCDIQAMNMDRLAEKTVRPGPVYTAFPTEDMGDLWLGTAGVRSSVQGSLELMTPLAEIPLAKVTRAEADAYRGWRDNYERNWRWGFDPLAIRLGLHKDGREADLTVMPLIWGSEYRQMVEVSQGAKFAPDAGDPHGAPMHFIMALNKQSQQFQQHENILSTIAQGASTGWIGSSVAVYFDDDPFWAEMAKKAAESEAGAYFLQSNIWRAPVGIRFEVADKLRLVAFLVGLRAFIEQTAPRMTAWQSLTYRDQPYVKVSLTESGKRELPPSGDDGAAFRDAAIYYASLGNSLLVTPSEKLLKRAIDRQLARAAAKATGPATSSLTKERKDAPPAAVRAWLGENVAMDAAPAMIGLVFGSLTGDDGAGRERAVQALSWSNLPILNEWKRRYPDQDPVAVHERVWKIRLVCPGGGRYVWNDQWQTMESTVYGHPGQPKPGPSGPPALIDFAHGSFGLTFENHGLRARALLERPAPGD